MNILEIKKSLIIIWLVVICSCSNNAIIIDDVKISFPGNNVLSALVELNTKDNADTYLQYSESGALEKPIVTQTSKQKKEHKFFLKKLKPGTQYKLNVIITKNKNKRFSKNYFFKTVGFYGEKQDSFQVFCADTSMLPTIFKNGFVMIHRREAPGIIAVVNAQGNIVWHHQAKNEGYKVVNYTPGKTFLCIMGSKDYETSYGNAILELSVSGDTLLYLKKGQNDFQKTIHHDILLNKKKQIVSLYVENRILDLRSRGGSEKDTVKGDGILVLDRKGNKVWKWSVFDEIDPLQDPSILKNKKDWMHANSLSFDKDGNYLVSFYNNGQIWKIDASTGK